MHAQLPFLLDVGLVEYLDGFIYSVLAGEASSQAHQHRRVVGEMFERLVEHLSLYLVFLCFVISIGQMAKRPLVAGEEGVALDERLRGLAFVVAAVAVPHGVVEFLQGLLGHFVLEQGAVGDACLVPTFLAEKEFGSLLQLVGVADACAEPFVLAHVEVAFEERIAHRFALGVHVAVAEEVVQIVAHHVEWTYWQDVVEDQPFLLQLFADVGHQVLVVGLHGHERTVLIGIALGNRSHHHPRPWHSLGVLVEYGLDVGLREAEWFEPMVTCAFTAEKFDLLEV